MAFSLDNRPVNLMRRQITEGDGMVKNRGTFDRDLGYRFWLIMWNG